MYILHATCTVCTHKVDQKGKVFSIADEFLQHCFTAHLLANICCQLKISSPSEPIRHENTQEWLHATAEQLLEGSLMSVHAHDPIYAMHRHRSQPYTMP